LSNFCVTRPGENAKKVAALIATIGNAAHFRKGTESIKMFTAQNVLAERARLLGEIKRVLDIDKPTTAHVAKLNLLQHDLAELETGIAARLYAGSFQKLLDDRKAADPFFVPVR
jgi:hypothetical protein